MTWQLKATRDWNWFLVLDVLERMGETEPIQLRWLYCRFCPCLWEITHWSVWVDGIPTLFVTVVTTFSPVAQGKEKSLYWSDSFSLSLRSFQNKSVLSYQTPITDEETSPEMLEVTKPGCGDSKPGALLHCDIWPRLWGCEIQVNCFMRT